DWQLGVDNRRQQREVRRVTGHGQKRREQLRLTLGELPCPTAAHRVAGEINAGWVDVVRLDHVGDELERGGAGDGRLRLDLEVRAPSRCPLVATVVAALRDAAMRQQDVRRV